MLYKNEEIYVLSTRPEEIKAIEKFFHNKFPVKVVYPPERIVPSKLKHNRLPDKPNSMSFDLKATVKTKNGTEVWRYAENVTVNEKGVKKYTPKKFSFNGARFLDRNEIELIYFLLKKSQYCKGGDNEGRLVKFVFEDLVSDADKKAEKKSLEAKIGGLLYGELALPEEKLRAVAKAYFVKNVDSLSASQVKIVLENKIHESKDGATRFFDMVNADDEIDTRVSIQKAIDMELLKFDANKKAWYWKTKEGKDIVACKVPPSKSATDSLYEFYNGDESFREDLKASLLTKKVKVGKKEAVGGGDPESDKED
jgi:hypothetical protein